MIDVIYYDIKKQAHITYGICQVKHQDTRNYSDSSIYSDITFHGPLWPV